MSEPITVAIPVGPTEANRRWLNDCLESVFAQTVLPEQVLLLFDGGPTCWIAKKWTDKKQLSLWRAPWHSGVAHMFNFGVGLARNNLVFLLGADDELEPDCLDRCLKTWEANGRQDAYYHVTIRYMDGRPDPIQTAPCSAVMVTKGLWRQTGGFPSETASGASDAAFISMLMVHRPEALAGVADMHPLYRYRVHDGTDTAQRSAWQGVIMQTRGLLTELGFNGRESV